MKSADRNRTLACYVQLNSTQRRLKNLKKKRTRLRDDVSVYFPGTFFRVFFLRLYLGFYFWARDGYKTILQNRRVFPLQSTFSFRRWPTNCQPSSTSVVRVQRRYTIHVYEYTVADTRRMSPGNAESWGNHGIMES